MSGAEGWQRVHPLSPIVRGGRATIAIAVLLVPTVLRGGDLSGSYVQLAIAGVLTALGFVSWLVTRWRIDGDEVPVRVGSFVRFDPEATRCPVAGPDGMTFVSVGARRGSYEPRGPF